MSQQPDREFEDRETGNEDPLPFRQWPPAAHQAVMTGVGCFALIVLQMIALAAALSAWLR